MAEHEDKRQGDSLIDRWLYTSRPNNLEERLPIGSDDEDRIDILQRLGFLEKLGKSSSYDNKLQDPEMLFLNSPVQLRLERKRRAANLSYFDHWLSARSVDIRPSTAYSNVLTLTQAWLTHPKVLVDRLRRDDEAILLRKLAERLYSWRALSPTERQAITPAVHNAERSKLETEIEFLKHQLQSNTLSVRIYNLGASSFLAAVFSLVVWGFTGIGVPLHPAFAALLVPVALGLILMAFLTRRDQQPVESAKDSRTTKGSQLK